MTDVPLTKLICKAEGWFEKKVLSDRSTGKGETQIWTVVVHRTHQESDSQKNTFVADLCSFLWKYSLHYQI